MAKVMLKVPIPIVLLGGVSVKVRGLTYSGRQFIVRSWSAHAFDRISVSRDVRNGLWPSSRVPPDGNVSV